MARSTAVATVVMALLCAAFPAEAQRTREAEQVARQAIERYDLGKYDEALDLYRKAHDLWPIAKLSFAESRCLEALGRLDEAVPVLNRALKENPDRDLKNRIEQRLVFLREKVKTGRLVLTVSPAGSEVVIDEKPRGNAPIAPVELQPGARKIVVRYPGFGQIAQVVEVKGGSETKMDIALQRLTGQLVLMVRPEGADVYVDGASRGLSPVAPMEIEAGTHQVEVKMAGVEPQVRTVTIAAGEMKTIEIFLGGAGPATSVVKLRKTRWYDSTWGWVALGTGVAAAGAGTALLFIGKSARDDVESSVAKHDSKGPSQSDLKSRWDSARTKETTGWVLVGVGGAALATSVVLFVVQPGSESASRSAPMAVGPAVSPGGGGIVVMGRF